MKEVGRMKAVLLALVSIGAATATAQSGSPAVASAKVSDHRE
jgi:hypothetical protein